MTEASLSDLAKNIREDVRRRWMDESLARMKKCIAALDEDQVWHRPNEESLTVGNILIHLAGNIRQWIISGLGNKPDHRMRDMEFMAFKTAQKEDMIANLERTLEEACDVLAGVDATQLLETYKVQGMEETGFSILNHITEHFSYHTGQVAYITKMLTGQQTAFYDDAKLREKNG